MMTEDPFNPTILIDEKTDGKWHVQASTCPAVCSKAIDVTVQNGIIESVRYLGGCAGNTKGISQLIAGMSVTDAVRRLDGIDCKGRGTSCPDQLAKILKYMDIQ